MQVPQAQLDAHFHAVHLIAIVAKLLPEWLPQSLFDLLLRQWNSPERHSRHAPHAIRFLLFPFCVGTSALTFLHPLYNHSSWVLFLVCKEALPEVQLLQVKSNE